MPKGEGFPPPPTSKAPAKTDDDVQESGGPIEVNASAWTGGKEHAPKGESWFNRLRDLVQKVEKVKQGPLDLDSSEGLQPLTKEERERHEAMREAGDVELVTKPMINLEDKDNLTPWTPKQIKAFEKDEQMKAAREAEAPDMRQARQGIELAKSAGITRERNQMHSALSERSTAYKAFLRSEAAFKKIKKPTDEEKLAHAASKTALLEAEAKHKASQVKMSTAMMESVRERLTAKGKDPEYIEKALSRYQGIVTFSEVHRSKARMENEARLEVAGEKKKNVFEKVGGWYRNLNEKVTNSLTKQLTGNKILGFGKALSERDAQRWARNGVRAARILGFATVGAGAGLLGGMGIGAALGIALGKIGVGALNIGTGVAVGYGAGEVFDRTVGGKREAAFTEARRSGVTSVEDIAALEAAHAKGSKEALTASRLKYEHGAAFITGAGMSLGSILQVVNTESIRNAIDAIMDIRVGSVSGALSNAAHKVAERSDATPTVAETAPQTSAINVGVSEETRLTGHNLGGEPPPPSAPDTSPEVASAASATASASESVASVEGNRLAISGNINNADRLVGHFGVQMQEQFEGKDAPKSVKSLFEMLKTEEGASLLRGEDQATLKLRLQMPNGESAVMQPGDSLSLNAKGEIVFERPGHPELTQTLIDANGEVHEAKGFQMSGGAVTETVSAPEVTKPSAPVEASVPAEPATSVAVETAPVASVEQTPAPEVAQSTPEAAPAQPIPPVEQAPAPMQPVPPVEQAPVPEPVTETPPTPEVAPVAEQAIPQAVEGAPFVSEAGVTIDPKAPHIYGDENGNVFAYGGRDEVGVASLISDAQEHAVRENVTVWIDESYNDALGMRVTRAQGFAPDGRGGVAMVISSDPKYSIPPTKFTKIIK